MATIVAASASSSAPKVFLATGSLDWFSRPAWAYSALNGWDLARLRSILEDEFDRAGMSPGARFWRQAPHPAQGKP